MDRFTVIVNDELGVEFRIEAVRQRKKLNQVFAEAMKLWLEKQREK
jgi:hypothetical protein